MVQKLSILASNEIIEEVQLWKNPLTDYQLTALKFYHCFLVIRTNNYWWSIEKNSEGITLQRSERLNKVTDWYQDERRKVGRTGIKKMQSMKLPNAQVQLSEFFKNLRINNELKKEYNCFSSNCQHFAERWYKFFKAQQTISTLPRGTGFIQDPVRAVIMVQKLGAIGFFKSMFLQNRMHEGRKKALTG